MIHAAPKSIERSYGDGAYDTKECYIANDLKQIEPIIPPQKNAKYREQAPPYFMPRNAILSEIQGLGADDFARALWKKLSGYHRRSLGETAMSRLKRIFGGDLKSRKSQNQRAEVRAKCQALNIMTHLGMPKGQCTAV